MDLGGNLPDMTGPQQGDMGASGHTGKLTLTFKKVN